MTFATLDNFDTQDIIGGKNSSHVFNEIWYYNSGII